MEYKVVIGLEVHAELKTESKIFCSCSTAFGAEANTQVCEICTGMPGTLPKLNEKVLEYAVRTGLALNCDITNSVALTARITFTPTCLKRTRFLSFICLFAQTATSKLTAVKEYAYTKCIWRRTQAS